MSITLVTGPANSGKAQVVLERRAPASRARRRADARRPDARRRRALPARAGRAGGGAVGGALRRCSARSRERAGVSEALGDASPRSARSARGRGCSGRSRRRGERRHPGFAARSRDLFAELEIGGRAGAARGRRWRVGSADGGAARSRSDLAACIRLLPRAPRAARAARRRAAAATARAGRAARARRRAPLGRARRCSSTASTTSSRCSSTRSRRSAIVVDAAVTVVAAGRGRPRRVRRTRGDAPDARAAGARADPRPRRTRTTRTRVPRYHLERSLFEPQRGARRRRAPPSAARRAAASAPSPSSSPAEIAELLAGGVRRERDRGRAARAPARGRAGRRVLRRGGRAAYALRGASAFADTALGARRSSALLRASPLRTAATPGRPRPAAGCALRVCSSGPARRPLRAGGAARRRARRRAARGAWEREHWPLDALDRLAAAQQRGAAGAARPGRARARCDCSPRRAGAARRCSGRDEWTRRARCRPGAARSPSFATSRAPRPELAPASAGELARCSAEVEVDSGELAGPGDSGRARPAGAARAARASAVHRAAAGGRVPGAGARRSRSSASSERAGAGRASSGLVLGDAAGRARRRALPASTRCARARASAARSAGTRPTTTPAPRRARCSSTTSCDLLRRAPRASAARAARARRVGSRRAGGDARTVARRAARRDDPLRDERARCRLRGAAWSASALERGSPARCVVRRARLCAGALEPEPEPLVRGALAHDALKETLRRRCARETGSARVTPATLGRSRSIAARRGSPDGAELRCRRPPQRAPASVRGCGPTCGATSSTRPRAEPLEPRELRARLRLRRCERASTASPRAAGVRARRRRRAARADRPRRRRRRAARPSSIDYKSRARRSGGEVDRRAQAPARALHAGGRAAARTCAPSAASTSRCGGQDQRARGALARGRRAGATRRATDRCEPGSSRELLGGALDGALEARARGRRRRAAGAPAELRVAGALPLPDDLPLRALSEPWSSSATSTCDGTSPAAAGPRADRASSGGGRATRGPLAALGGGGQRQDQRARRALRRAPCVEDGIAPARILAITFTDRAAGELRERVRARLLDAGRREAARDTEAAFVGTFHGFCARLLRAHPLPAGSTRTSRCSTSRWRRRCARCAFADALSGFVCGRRRTAVDLLAAYGVDRVRASGRGDSTHELRSRGELPAARCPRRR